MSTQRIQDWLETAQGQYVLRWEQARFDHLVADVFGFNAIQIGLPEQDFLRMNRMPFRSICAVEGACGVQADPQQLPFASASVDLVLLPHVLEFDTNPHQVLREVERVLVPEGQLIITGFNPFSLWGAKRRFSAQPRVVPWNGNFISVPRLRDWFSLLGFEVRAGRFGCYAPAMQQESNLQRCRFMELAGDRWWPFAGAVYVLQAIKRVQGMRLITPAWRGKQIRSSALAPVVQRNDND